MRRSIVEDIEGEALARLIEERLGISSLAIKQSEDLSKLLDFVQEFNNLKELELSRIRRFQVVSEKKLLETFLDRSPLTRLSLSSNEAISLPGRLRYLDLGIDWNVNEQ